MERLDDPADQTRLQRERGCHEPALAPFRLGEEDLWRCPMRLVRWGEINAILDLWPHLKAGRYPCAGGYADQPALFVDVLGALDSLPQKRANDGE